MTNTMSRRQVIRHEFVEFVPEELADGMLYVSIPYSTAVHKCCCGCGSKVVTPFSPTDWELSFNGKSVSLAPSIGSWSLKCRSHYWITHDQVEWARSWSREEIDAGRARDRRAKERYYPSADDQEVAHEPKKSGNKNKKSTWQRIKGWL